MLDVFKNQSSYGFTKDKEQLEKIKEDTNID